MRGRRSQVTADPSRCVSRACGGYEGGARASILWSRVGGCRYRSLRAMSTIREGLWPQRVNISAPIPHTPIHARGGKQGSYSQKSAIRVHLLECEKPR